MLQNVLQEKPSNKGSLDGSLWPLDKHIEFDHQQAWDKTPVLPAPAAGKSKDPKYNAKVSVQSPDVLSLSFGAS